MALIELLRVETKNAGYPRLVSGGEVCRFIAKLDNDDALSVNMFKNDVVKPGSRSMNGAYLRFYYSNPSSGAAGSIVVRPDKNGNPEGIAWKKGDTKATPLGLTPDQLVRQDILFKKAIGHKPENIGMQGCAKTPLDKSIFDFTQSEPVMRRN